MSFKHHSMRCVSVGHKGYVGLGCHQEKKNQCQATIAEGKALFTYHRQRRQWEGIVPRETAFSRISMPEF